MLIPLLLALAVQPQAAHPGMSREQHIKVHGASAMGFDQDKTTHYFPTTATGGSIEVDANDAADEASRVAIRMHLKAIAAAFARGDFEKPFETHGEVPPGVPELQRLKDSIRYKYEDSPRGGVVRITTSNPDALRALHQFLTYQAREHHMQ